MPLSTTGISHQIVSSIWTYRIEKLGTINDCKVVINHLVRKFSEPLTKEGLQKSYSSVLVKDDTQSIKEHVLPVKEIMEYLLKMDLDESKSEFALKVHEFLVKALILVEISQEEDEALNQNGFQQKMPSGYQDPSSVYYQDLWARYKSAGIFENIEF